jgi:transcriptional regulator with XRE-family HTH domain
MTNGNLTLQRGANMAPVDLHVARRIRGKRRALGLSVDRLASALGVEAGRIEAYERATERVPSNHLVRLGEILDVPLSYFLPATSCANQ